MTKSILFSFLLTFSLTLFSQTHWESIILESDTWNYLPATSEPPSDWMNLSFNDETWEQGPGGIGYADGDDSTTISNVNSLYLRRVFSVSDTSLIERIILDIDYDDAFVAYLNGVEISRSYNITDETPSYNSTLTTWIEAKMYQGGQPERSEIEKTLLSNGENILSVHIINNNISSSDLSARVFLSAQINSPSVIYNNTPTWFVEPPEIIEPEDFEQSNLPIIVINTISEDIKDDPKVIANMGIINNGLGAINNITDTFNDYDGLIAIEWRGESSQMFEKKSYLLETRDDLGENNNVSLLGMPEENDWILYAPYSDKSLLRNTVTYELGRLTGNYCTRTAYCELVVNGDYKGVYVLMEKIKKDAERVDIATLNTTEITGNDLTGGYIFRVDKLDEDYTNDFSGFTSEPSPAYDNAMDITYQYFYPQPEDLADEQRNYIRNAITDAEKTLIATSYDDPDVGYNQYLNVGSFVDFLLINEIPKEVDNYRYSTYFHKKKDSKGGEIFAGPLWDFNLGYANVDYWDDGLNTEGWLYENVDPWEWSIMFWWKRLMEDAFFEDLTTTRWNYLRQNEFSDENVTAIIDSITNYIDEAQQRNYVRWPILGTYVWPNYNWQGNDYLAEVAFFENWLFDRLDWMDKNMLGSTLYPAANISHSENSNSQYIINLNIELTDDYFNHAILNSKHFTLNNAPSALTIDSVYYTNASEATISLYNGGSSVSTDDFSVTIDKKLLNGFRDITSNKVDVLSVGDVQFAEAEVSIYSHNGTLTLKCDRPSALPQSVDVYNTLGQLVATYNVNQQHINTISINLEPNIYIVHLMVDKAPYTERIIITK